MAKGKGQEQRLDYRESVKRLQAKGPGRLYMLWGKETYLRDSFLNEIKKLCIPDGEDSFSYKKIAGADIDIEELAGAVDAVPFLSERTLVELRDVDLNKTSNADGIIAVLSDIPEYCTVVFCQGSSFEPDRRLKLNKFIKANGEDMCFTAQGEALLTGWIVKRFAALGKEIDPEAVRRLMFISGTLMSGLIPEIEKVAAYAKGECVTVEDVNAVANHISEADIFEMTDLIAQKKYDAAFSLLNEVLANKDNEPIAITAIMGNQFRRLYCARVALEEKKGAAYVMKCCGINYEFIAKKLMSSAAGFSLERLRRAVELCAETDYGMKSSAVPSSEQLKELVMKIAAGVERA